MENDQQNIPQPTYQTPLSAQYQSQGVPAEVPSRKTGKVMGILSVILGSLSVIFTIFTAPIGIILGALAISRGEKILGVLGIILSIFMMIIGLAIGFIYLQQNPDASGLILINF